MVVVGMVVVVSGCVGLKSECVVVMVVVVVGIAGGASAATFSPKVAKQKWQTLEQNINKVAYNKQTVSSMERDMERQSSGTFHQAEPTVTSQLNQHHSDINHHHPADLTPPNKSKYYNLDNITTKVLGIHKSPQCTVQHHLPLEPSHTHQSKFLCHPSKTKHCIHDTIILGREEVVVVVTSMLEYNRLLKVCPHYRACSTGQTVIPDPVPIQ
ncbi:hypothetical protein E2C01_011234 [Portunus trituberculatus]|uniref:KIF21A/B second helical domain-containing protein n=1 Tax=Portunus trituberculatus TaxID=210409 RepID=A0A5B7DB53_PORTR|nr:hypothetical protein [Portunus trituberculatus]